MTKTHASSVWAPFAIVLLVLQPFATPVFAETSNLTYARLERVWKSGEEDTGEVHALGNGAVCVYGQGPNIMQFFGPPYSSPSFGSLVIESTREIESRSRRVRGAAIWRHEMRVDGKPVGEMTDFVDSDANVLVRKTQFSEPITFTLRLHPRSSAFVQDAKFRPLGANHALYVEVPSGTFIFATYPTVTERAHLVIASGACSIDAGPEDLTWTVRCGAGEGFLRIVGAANYPECVEESERALASPWDQALERTNEFWREFMNRRKDFSNELTGSPKRLGRLLEVIDHVAVLIKAQQGRDGAVLAGHAYHLGYVRDQYGVSRALLKMGYSDEARLVLRRYWGVYRELGRINNAHGIGVGGISHVHENDDVEITGYILIQAFDYLDNTGDRGLLLEMFPLLEWCWEAQKKHLVDGMLPFNGDETYVAGGILPRWCLLDGSAESTLLFVTGGSRLLKFIEEEDLWPKERLDRNWEILLEVRNKFHDNFWEDGRLLTNNPARRLGANAAKTPRFRHGVCEDNHAWGWGERNENGRYCSPAGIVAAEPLPFAAPKKFSLISVSMLPLYIGSDLLTPQEIEATLEDVARNYEETGRLTSTPGSDRTVGHEFGLLLHSMNEIGHDGADAVYDETMSLLDPTGAWVEYYVDNAPSGCRCRPWESAINLEAALRYLDR